MSILRRIFNNQAIRNSRNFNRLVLSREYMVIENKCRSQLTCLLKYSALFWMKMSDYTHLKLIITEEKIGC
jgi:hypothetical protein